MEATIEGKLRYGWSELLLMFNFFFTFKFSLARCQWTRLRHWFSTNSTASVIGPNG